MNTNTSSNEFELTRVKGSLLGKEIKSIRQFYPTVNWVKCTLNDDKQTYYIKWHIDPEVSSSVSLTENTKSIS